MTIYKSITPESYTLRHYVTELWKARGLAMAFARRDIKAQFAQSYLGIAWTLIQPLTALAIFSLFFNKLVKLDVGVPYAVFAYTGIMCWYFFSQIVGQAGISLMSNQHLIRKMSFPRLVLPLSKVMVGLFEFTISFVALLCILVLSGTALTWKLLLVPLLALLLMITGLSVAVWLSALTVRFRDFHHLIPFLIGFGIWATPVFYPQSIIPEAYNWVYYLHPVAGCIHLFRWMIYGADFNAIQVLVSLTFSALLLVAGLIVFIKNEKHLADFI